jgi:hypothetical protein
VKKKYLLIVYMPYIPHWRKSLENSERFRMSYKNAALIKISFNFIVVIHTERNYEAP